MKWPVYAPRDAQSAKSRQVWTPTVARELRRNGSKTQGYRPSYAQQQASARRWRGCLDRDPLLREQVLARLGPPTQVSTALESGGTVISHETIYASSTAGPAKTGDCGQIRRPAFVPE